MTRLAASLASKDPQAIMDHHAKSFSWAARFLSAPARRDAALLYAYARTADDFADEEHWGTLSQRTEALQALRQQHLKQLISVIGYLTLVLPIKRAVCCAAMGYPILCWQP